MKKINFIHDGNAMYPLVKAMRASYSDVFDIDECSFKVAAQKHDLGQSICWHMMGFYTKRLPAPVVIHDYRSLSLGIFGAGWVKDRLKVFLNTIPDIRIIQPSIQNKLGFKDDVKTFLLDVAISEKILDFKINSPIDHKFDFCYIGSMKAERRIERMIDSFLRNYSGNEILVMVGAPEEYLLKRYAHQRTKVIFTGALSQAEAFQYVRDSRVAIAYFPDHFPHIYQTPTKLLEYSAVGSRILANPQVMNVEKAKQYKIEAVWRPSNDMFSDLPAMEEWPTNTTVDVRPMLFSTHIKQSGLHDFLLDLAHRT